MRSLIGALLLALTLVTAPPLSAQQVETLSGAAHNVTVGVRDRVTLQLTRHADGSYGLTGTFGPVNLAGDITAIGYPPSFEDGYPACAERHECILFGGTIALDERAGFDNGTETVFALHLDLDAASNTGIGVYHIGPLPGFTFQQYGTVTLAIPIS